MLISELNENKYKPEEISSDPVWLANFIRTYCKEWLAQTHNGRYVVYRGTKAGNLPVYIKDTRSNRRPSDTSLRTTKIMNNLIKLVGGTANRNNSVFVSGSYEQAEGYGTVYVYIPIGPFSFTWSPVWRDWFDVFYDQKHDVAGGLIKSGNSFKTDQYLNTKFIDWAEYYDVLYDQIFDENNLNTKLLDMDNVRKHISTTDLVAAVTSSKEIMIASYSGIYIKADLYFDKVNPLIDSLLQKQSSVKVNQEPLSEGPNDPHQKKAVFLLGGPGSGKSTVAKKLFSHTGMRSVNIDSFYEMFTKKLNLAGGYNQEVYKLANEKNMKRLELFLQENLGVVIDGTGRNLEKVKSLYTKLQKLGYDIAAVFVNTDLETALSRNETRPRKVDPELVKKMHKESTSNLGEFQRVFKDKMLIIDNSNELQLDYAFNKITKFINTKR